MTNLPSLKPKDNPDLTISFTLGQLCQIHRASKTLDRILETGQSINQFNQSINQLE